MAGQQLRLMLWKDYLMRKRKLVTLTGILWATAVMFSLYIVRINVDNSDFSTCHFPARALPSAGMITFLQSFICSVNNECSNKDKFQEIPTYENSRLTKLQRQLSPILNNDTVLEVAGSVPGAIKLLATLADIVDQPTFLDITKNGLRVNDLFRNPSRVRRYLSSRLDVDDDVAKSVMAAEISFEGAIKGDIDRCKTDSMSKTLTIQNAEHLEILVRKLCEMSDEEIQGVLLDLLTEIEFSKYIKMIGEMFTKLSGDDRITALADTITAVLRMSKIESFLPSELAQIVGVDTEFNYFNVSILPKIIDLFKPTFSETQTFKAFKDLSNGLVLATRYLNKFLLKQRESIEHSRATGEEVSGTDDGLKVVSRSLSNAIEMLQDAMKGSSDDFGAVDILHQLLNFIYKWLPDETKHDVLFYSTLLTKLVESSQKVIDTNLHIEELAYNVSLRNPQGVKVLVGLPSQVVGKGFEALADAERTQILTAKVNFPGQMFCDNYRIQTFFRVSKDQAAELKKQLCTDEWKSYVVDLITSFGIYQVRDNINSMASLVIQETIGKDTTDQIYSLEHIFTVLKQFIRSLTSMGSVQTKGQDWERLFEVGEKSDVMKVVKEKAGLGKQMLIVVHGALAKEVVKQNSILSFKISPILIDTTTIVVALNKQLQATPHDLTSAMNEMYGAIVETVMGTAFDEYKTYKSLTTHSEQIMCHGIDNASQYINIPKNVDEGRLINVLCNASEAIESGMRGDSVIGLAIKQISSSKRPPFGEVNWTTLITSLKDLYIKLNSDYPYLFDSMSYGMDSDGKERLRVIVDKAKEYWFGKDALGRSLQLSIKLAFRTLDLLDHGLFNITAEPWIKLKYSFHLMSGPFAVIGDFVELVADLSNNKPVSSNLPPTTVIALSDILPNLPQLINESVTVIVKDDVDASPIISLLNSDKQWPCFSSLTDVIQLSMSSRQAVIGLEKLFCMDSGMVGEWRGYLDGYNATIANTTKWNTTEFNDHEFLRFSSVLDSLIFNTVVLKESLQSVFNNSEPMSFVAALNYAVDVFNGTSRDLVLSNFFTKMDTVLNAIDTSSTKENVSLSTLWEGCTKCFNSNIDNECQNVKRAAFKYTLYFVSTVFQNLADDLLTYFGEVNEPNSSVLQLFGFTRSTPLYTLYDKLPEFVEVLINSYLDYGFMSQIRRATLSQFWDCEAVIAALAPSPWSPISKDAIYRIQPYVCPSLLYWISLPRGDNVVLDVIAKPQYYFYTIQVKNMTSNFKEAFTKSVGLANLLTDIAKTNKSLISEDDLKLNTIQNKLVNTLDRILSYKINKTDQSYKTFKEINEKELAANIYLARIVVLVNKIQQSMENIDTNKTEELNLKEDVTNLVKAFKRRPHEALALHFDVLTDVLWRNEIDYKISSAMKSICDSNNETMKTIVNENNRVKTQICARKYEIVYETVQDGLDEDLLKARESLLNLVKVLQSDDEAVNDIFEFLRQRKQLITSLQTTIKYAYDLSLPLYLKYLQTNIRHYDVIVSFLSGEDWWESVRDLYRGEKAQEFFDAVEKSFEVAEDVLSNLDGIHLVRLLRDINVNSTESFCQLNISISDYIPDRSGLLSSMKQRLCEREVIEVPPLVYAYQGYDDDYKLSKQLNFTTIDNDITKTEYHLIALNTSFKSPILPQWIDDVKLSSLRSLVIRLVEKESLTRIAFGVAGNLVDASTLFLNSSQCTVCSELTTWFKQLNLQLFKKQEYDTLLCHLEEMSLASIHHTLKEDFHWDMVLKELISTRNYTKYELNKSINEFLEQMKLHLLDDLNSNSTKMSECLTSNVTRNAMGNATLFLTVLSHTIKLIRAELPFLHEIDGMLEVTFLKQLSMEISPKLDVYRPLKDYIGGSLDAISGVADQSVLEEVLASDVNLRLIMNPKPATDYIRLQNSNWLDICTKYNCSEIDLIVDRALNKTIVEKDLPTLQSKSFWRFTFLTKLLGHIEELLSHGARILGVASELDIEGAMEGKLAAILDLGLQVMMDDKLKSILYSLQGLIEELRPLLKDTDLEFDLQAMAKGLEAMQRLKTDILEKQDLKIQVSELFPDAEKLEWSLTKLGINNTNFWSIAAPRIRAGYIDLKPLLTHNSGHISDYVCRIDKMSRVILPSNLEQVTAEDVFYEVIEQFCELKDNQPGLVMAAVFGGANGSLVVEKVTNYLLTKLYASSNLTYAEGASIITKYPQMAALLPLLQDRIHDLMDEPLFKDLSDFKSVGGLLGSPQFLSSAGMMMCGAPFKMNDNKFIKSVISSQDYSMETDIKQLEVLPTDFCRSLYKDIVSMQGGKIVWSFVKPLIMGKIIYTPANPVVERIIHKANSSFGLMLKLTSLVHSFSGAFPYITKMSEHRNGLTALKQVASAPALTPLTDSLIGQDVELNVDVDGLFEEFGDLESVGNLLSKASSLLRCLNLNRFQAAANEDQLAREAARLTRVNEFSAGLVFMNTEEHSHNVEYKIRMDIENVPTTSRLKNYLWVPGPESSFLEDMRYFRGFIQIQDIIDKAIIDLSRERQEKNRETNSVGQRRKRDFVGHRRKREDFVEQSQNKEDNISKVEWAVYTQQEPYPCYRKDFFQTSLYESQSLIVAMFFSLLFSVASAVRFIVSDKETGNTMLLSVMGVELKAHTWAWAISTSIEMLFTIVCICMVLCMGRVLPSTEPTLLFVLLCVYGVSVIAFCYMMSKLFKSASLASVCTAIAYLMTYMPFIIILSLEAVISKTVKLIVCLSMSSALSYASLHIARAEASGRGLSWAQLFDSDTEDVGIGLSMVVMVFDAMLYVVVGWVVDRFYGIQNYKTNLTTAEPVDEKSGVSILNITKVYGEGTKHEKVALDNVSIELRKGEITALLGHNGAGKTTLINIALGALRPTHGHIVSRGVPRVGLCPQSCVLYSMLTVREHVALYAQITTGKKMEEVRDDVDNMLTTLSLTSISDVRVCNLSGGTRRRVCVSLSFVGDPALVALDEPSAGVHPEMRRDIWNMISRLKENRTILITTHHMDEAEMLSDQIVILHKGQVHTTGSPIEIKRSLGSGYKLTITYPSPTEDCTEHSTEDKTTRLMEKVTSVVKNASLVDVNETEVEVNLPFYDCDGLNNDYLRLCEELENHQVELQYDNMYMDCATLEQIFHNIAQAEVRNDVPELPSKNSSSSSVRNDLSPLVPGEGVIKGTWWQQFTALLYARYLHYSRNTWLLFLLLVLPSLFVTTAMAFSLIRPPADNEVALKLHPELYAQSTQYAVRNPSTNSKDIDPTFANRVMDLLIQEKHWRNWTENDTPQCDCVDHRQQCEVTGNKTAAPEMMVLPDVDTLNKWIVASHDAYVEKRYGGFSSSLTNNISTIIAWYNNKGHHAMPSFLSAVNNAILRSISDGNITTYTHPLKISKEQLSKDTVYQHVADAGISGLILLAYCIISAACTIYTVQCECCKLSTTLRVTGITPLCRLVNALVCDMIVIVINIGITAAVLSVFGFPVFVARNNLPAICILIFLYGITCSCAMQLLSRAFTDASMANMILFCGNAFVGLAGITILLILDIISESETTDNARWWLHKLLLVFPQFVLGDGMLEVAKNSIQAQVLSRFGMDTYKDPLSSDLIAVHYAALVVVGFVLMVVNIAIEYDWFYGVYNSCLSSPPPLPPEPEAPEVSLERRRVRNAIDNSASVRIPTIGNINAGFIDTEAKNGSLTSIVAASEDVLQCLDVTKKYPALDGENIAVNRLTLGLPKGQCTVLLGQNGAGKSTTFAMLCGELRPSGGRLYLRGRRAGRRDLRSGHISYCPQNDAIDELLTVRETLELFCRLRGIEDMDEVITRTLQMFDLTRYSAVFAGKLSGGNKRKLCTAVAFMGRSSLVLLDEPTSGMDPSSCRQLAACVRECAAARAVLLSTHALQWARAADTRALLHRGRLWGLQRRDMSTRFSGYSVRCRVSPGACRAVSRRVWSRAPHATLEHANNTELQFFLPATVTVDSKETVTKLSDIFRLMAELQGTCDIEDYTINQSSLDQMFLGVTDNPPARVQTVDLEPLPSHNSLRRNSEELDSITSL